MRIADNMRNVAVTEGDKVEAQIRFGWEIDAYPVNEIAEAVQAVGKGDVDALVEEYYSKYQILLEGRDPEEFKKHVPYRHRSRSVLRDSWKRRIIRRLLLISVILAHCSSCRVWPSSD